MMSWIVLLVVLLALIVLGTWAWGSVFGHRPVSVAAGEQRDLKEVNRRALAAGELDAVEFDVVKHGYRQDQVDEVIDALRKQLAQRAVVEKD